MRTSMMTRLLLARRQIVIILLSCTTGYYPASIVTAGTTWLGDEFDSALLNGALIEAIRFLKGEPDMVAMYERLYVQAIGLLKNLGDGKLREDAFRSGQYRVAVT
jgi:hypothetical protein